VTLSTPGADQAADRFLIEVGGGASRLKVSTIGD
jgi:hypothetical protein